MTDRASRELSMQGMDFSKCPPCLAKMTDEFLDTGVPVGMEITYITSLLKFFYKTQGANITKWRDKAEGILSNMVGPNYATHAGTIEQILAKKSHNKVVSNACLCTSGYCDKDNCTIPDKAVAKQGKEPVDFNEVLPPIIAVWYVNCIGMGQGSIEIIAFQVSDEEYKPERDEIITYELEGQPVSAKVRKITFEERDIRDPKAFSGRLFEEGLHSIKDFPSMKEWVAFRSAIEAMRNYDITETDLFNEDPKRTLLGCFKTYIKNNIQIFNGDLSEAIDLIPQFPQILVQNQFEYYVSFSIPSFFKYAKNKHLAVHDRSPDLFRKVFMETCKEAGCNVIACKDADINAGGGQDSKLELYHAINNLSCENLYDADVKFIQSKIDKDEASKKANSEADAEAIAEHRRQSEGE